MGKQLTYLQKYQPFTLILQPWQVQFCKNRCASILLNHFLYQYDQLTDKTATYNFVQSYTRHQLVQELAGLYGSTAISIGLKKLCEKGVLVKNSKNNSPSRKIYYEFKPEICDKWLSTYRVETL